MDTLLDPVIRDYIYSGSSFERDPSDGLGNAVYIRLMTPLGSFWADATLGSRLHELEREKDVARIAILAKQYSEDALAPILADGRAESIDVNVFQPHTGRLNLQIIVVDESGRKATFNYPVQVY